MNSIRFEWDEVKNLANQKKHGVSFETATRVFLDPLLLMRQDRFEDGEERWQSIGLVDGYVMLLVAHTVWEEDDHGHIIETIRIISAREASRRERRDYENGEV